MGSTLRSEVVKDDKFGILSGSYCGLAELAALLFYKVLTSWSSHFCISMHLAVIAVPWTLIFFVV